MKLIEIRSISIPPMSSVGLAYGVAVETGEEIVFAGDHRCLRHIGEALQSSDDPVEAQVESWQILSVNTVEQECGQ